MKKLTEKFNSISVKVGEKFAIELEENAATGYLWGFTASEGCSFASADVTAKVRAIGAPNRQTWVFEAEETGMISITAEYSRPWEKKAPAKVCKFKIEVK